MTNDKPYHIYHFNWRGLFQAFWETSPQGEISPGCLWIPLLLIQIILLIPHVLFSHLKVGSDGIEYRSWPFYRYRITWNNLSAIERYSISRLITFDYLVIKDPTNPNNDKPKKFIYLDHRKMISLSGFQSWPNGRLAQDLEQYIPEIMAAWHKQKTQTNRQSSQFN